MTVIVGFLPLIQIFAIACEAGKRFSAVCGAAVSLIAIACSIVPPFQVTKVWLFEGKLALGTLTSIASGWALYRRAIRTKNMVVDRVDTARESVQG